MVPKKGVNKWRLILDLSSPEGHSVNDAISPDLCSLSYISVDDAAKAVTRVGRGALLAKVDIKNAYRIVEVHPEDRLLLGMQFEGLLIVEVHPEDRLLLGMQFEGLLIVEVHPEDRLLLGMQFEGLLIVEVHPEDRLLLGMQFEGLLIVEVHPEDRLLLGMQFEGLLIVEVHPEDRLLLGMQFEGLLIVEVHPEDRLLLGMQFEGLLIVEVHPEDRLLLGMQFEGLLYVDSVFSFGLRSAPKIFTAIVDALEWIVSKAGVRTLFHYLDDFLIVAHLASNQCRDDLCWLLDVFTHLRIPIAEDKLEGPTKSLLFLGIELDSDPLPRTSSKALQNPCCSSGSNWTVTGWFYACLRKNSPNCTSSLHDGDRGDTAT